MSSIYFETIPEDLKKRGGWVCWRYETRAGKRTKVPKNPKTGENARSNDSSTWGTYRQARAVVDGFDGIGLMFSGDLCGVDLDECRDPESGKLEPWAARIIADLDSYAEASPSGTGVHILFLADDLPGRRRRKGRVELYGPGSPRFFTVTGNNLPGVPGTVNPREEALGRFYAQYLAEPEDARSKVTPVPVTGDVQDLLVVAFAAKNGPQVKALFDEAGHDGASEGDAALAGHLAFYSGGDARLLERLLLASNRVRDKWHTMRGGETYIARECRLAVERHAGPWYTPPATRDEPASPDDLAAAHGQDSRSEVPAEEETTGETAAKEPRVLTLRDLPLHTTADNMAAQIGETEWLWPRWLPIGHLSVMAAKRGVGKSALALWLENVVATGGPWPDCPGNGEPGYALHVESESFQGGHSERMRLWGVAADRILYLGADGLASIKLEDPQALEAVRRLVQFYGVKLVVVDALRRATNADENDSRLAAILSGWADMARDTKCALLLLHHIGKGYDGSRPPTIDDLRGTSAIADVARSALGLWTPDPSRPGAVSVLQMKASLLSAEEAEKATFSFEWDPAGGLDFDIPEPSVPHDETELDRAEEFILAAIRRNGFAKRKDLLPEAEAANVNRDRVDQAAKRLKSRGIILAMTLPARGRVWVLAERRRGSS